MLKNIVKHFITITKHKIKVFELCIKAGISFRGFMHDWSKYSPAEFFESAKYYHGDRSPIIYCKQDKGYSKAWLHHKGRNKHHHEYWVDFSAEEKAPIIPYKYTVEMICDGLAAGMIYAGKDWTTDYEIKYWNRTRHLIIINPKIEKVIVEVYERVAKSGVDSVINKKELKAIYDKYVHSS